MNLIPAPGTDYTSKAKLMAALDDGAEFLTADIMSGYGHWTTKRELVALGQFRNITIRYAKLSKVIYIP